jgi:hypothetical protein
MLKMIKERKYINSDEFKYFVPYVCPDFND